jgi:flagellar FliL protein
MMHSTLLRWAGLCLLFCAAAAVLAADDEEAPVEETGYFALAPSIVSNLSGGPKYIRCDVQLMTRHASEIPKIELHAAAVRHAILMLLSGQDGKKLKTREGKEALRKAALDETKAQLEALTGNPIVDDLYFTAYYVK